MRILVVVLWLLLGVLYMWGWYSSQDCCTEQGTEMGTVITQQGPADVDQPSGENTQLPEAEDYLLAFNWSSDSVLTGDQFPAFKDSILAEMISARQLDIVGQYYPNEAYAGTI